MERSTHCYTNLQGRNNNENTNTTTATTTNGTFTTPVVVPIPVAELVIYKESMQCALDASVAQWLGNMLKAKKLYHKATSWIDIIVFSMNQHAVLNDSENVDLKIITHFKEIFLKEQENCVRASNDFPNF